MYLLTAPVGTFTPEQITSVTTALQTAIDNVLGIFVQLLPIVAVIAGITFGMRFIMARFRKIGK
jgi:hypothetical protein